MQADKYYTEHESNGQFWLINYSGPNITARTTKTGLSVRVAPWFVPWLGWGGYLSAIVPFFPELG